MTRKFSLGIAMLLCLLAPVVVKAGDEDSTKLILDQIGAYFKLRDSVNNALKYESGKITLPSGIVELNVPEGFKFLNATQSSYVVTELWGNPPMDDIQGMLFPANSDPFTDSSYAYIISYSAVGHVTDADAKDIDYDDLMKNMRLENIADNEQRRSMGITPMYTENWAAKPYYDESNKVLHWALDLRVEDEEEHTLNYKIIALGRNGMLTMNAIAGIGMLDMVKADVNKVLGMASFTPGNQYSDFDSKIDNVAGWTVGGLVAGKILAKTAAGAGILKFLKFIIIGVVAAGGAIWKWISGRRKKKEEELVYEPVVKDDNSAI